MKFNINRYLIHIMKTLGVDISMKTWNRILLSRKYKCFCWQDYCNGRTVIVDKDDDFIVDTPIGGFMIEEESIDKED